MCMVGQDYKNDSGNNNSRKTIANYLLNDGSVPDTGLCVLCHHNHLYNITQALCHLKV